MAQEKVIMKKIREVLRLKHECGLSHAKIARAVQIGETTVGEYLARFRSCESPWPLSEEINDELLEKLLYPPRPHSSVQRAMPDFSYIHKEYQRKGVTLQLLWQEYAKANSNALAYSRFCELYKNWSLKHEVWMPQQHKFGEEAYIDYSGLTVRVYTSRVLEEFYDAQIFVGVLGASNYTYIEATATQQLHDWIGSHRRMWEFFGGCSDLAIPDNLKSGITTSHRYEPFVNPTYREMAQHYGYSVVPARSKKPKDKSKVEKAVQDIQNNILAPIRDQKFYCLTEVNIALRVGLDAFNRHPFQKIPGSRRSLYEEYERPALNPLPTTPYEFAHWAKGMVQHNYHVSVEKHYYSVPYKCVRYRVEIRFNENVVEIFHQGTQIAIHPKSSIIGGYSTNPNHLSPSHQHHVDCSPEKLLDRASKIGPNTLDWVEKMLMNDSLHIREREKRSLGVIRLSKTFGDIRLEQACKRAVHYNIFSFKSIESMLQSNHDQKPIPDKEVEQLNLPQQHDNIRGSTYFE